MSSIYDVFSTVEKLERNNLMTYEVYQQVTTHPGMAKLLAGILQHVREHVRAMENFGREESGFSNRFREPPQAAFDAARFDTPVSFDALVSYTDSLRTIIQREKEVADLYDLLSSMCRDETDAFFFRHLSDDVKRHISWTQDRLDLETMLAE